MSNWKCRYAPSLGPLEDTPLNIWGTPHYDPKYHIEDPVCFFGLYGLPDFYELWKHKGIKEVLWAGSDILHLKDGYWLEDGGNIRFNRFQFNEWLRKYCGHWVENEVERLALLDIGIVARITPSFLGNVDSFSLSYSWNRKPMLYTSVSGDNFKMYGWDMIDKLAKENPGIEFHLYGTSHWKRTSRNIFVHGRVSKEQMNEEIKDMQGALRLTKHDGFSEILAKSILMGQWPVSLIEYPHMLKISEIGKIKEKKKQNTEGQDYYLKTLNNFPWNLKK